MGYDLQNSLSFLNKLNSNNNKEWFTENKALYETAHKNVISFSDLLLEQLQENDKIETISGKKALHRIYRDVRFSKDKTPYKSNFSGSYKRATQALRGGYYFHLEPGNCFLAGGFWGPSPEDLKHIREQIAQDDSPFRKVLTNKSFKNHFGPLLGDQLKTAPKGFEKDHPAIDLLRYKQFLVKHDYTDEQVYQPDFHKTAFKTFIEIRPFFDCISEYLTTDLNGVSRINE